VYEKHGFDLVLGAGEKVYFSTLSFLKNPFTQHVIPISPLSIVLTTK
jgi:hypothetical protein